MTVLIQPDTITVLQPVERLDSHGWAEVGGETRSGQILGTVQERAPQFDPTETEAGGFGQNHPFHLRYATAYLSEQVRPGDIMEVTNGVGVVMRWRVQSARFVEDPRRGNPYLNVWVAECVEAVTYG